MRVLLLTLLLPTIACAQWSVSLQRSNSDGVEKIEFVQKKGAWSYLKTTTLFDGKVDARLGVFRPADPKIFAEWPKLLSIVEQTHRKALDILKGQGAGKDILNPRMGHDVHAVLNGLTIAPRTPAFEALSKLLLRQTKETFVQLEGAALSADRKILVAFKDGKEVRKDYFSEAACASQGKSLKCYVGKWGLLYLDITP